MRDFSVTFLNGKGEQGKKLKGDGIITVSDNEVVLTRSEIPGWFWNTPAETITIKFENIANVVYNKEETCVQICEYRNRGFSGKPFNVFYFLLDDSSEQDELFELLPKQESEEVVMEAEFKKKLKQLTPYPFFTFFIVAICVLVYIFMGVVCGSESLSNPSGITLLRFGADYGPLVVDGEWYRIITSAFVHIGIGHILFNMLILLQIGLFVERLYGNMLFLVVYLGSAVTGSLISLTVHPTVISAGASGAIFGLYGALLAYMVCQRGAIPLHMVSGIRNGAIAFIAFNLIYGMQTGIDNWCHLGGLLGGFFLGAAVAPPIEFEGRHRHSYIKAIGETILVAVLVFFFLLTNPTRLNPEIIGNALAELGIYYNTGNTKSHITKDVNTAIDYYNRAMKYNNTVAIFNLGVIYRDGDGVEKDEAKALEMFKKSAELGYADAQFEYGHLLYYEKENKKEGFEWMKKASENNSKNARFCLACIYYDGDENVKQNQEYALNEFKELATSKYKPAIILLKQLENDSASETSNSEDEPAPVENVEQEDN